MLTMADKGGEGFWTPPFLADKVCEQPLIVQILKIVTPPLYGSMTTDRRNRATLLYLNSAVHPSAVMARLVTAAQTHQAV